MHDSNESKVKTTTGMTQIPCYICVDVFISLSEH